MANQTEHIGAPPITVRKAVDDDWNFIYSSWLKSNRGAKFYSDVSNEVYFTYSHRVIERIKDGANLTLIAEAEGVIIGWACGYPWEGILHYVYTKQAFRRMGVAKELVRCIFLDPKDQLETCTALTDVAKTIIRKRGMNVSFNPFLL